MARHVQVLVAGAMSSLTGTAHTRTPGDDLGIADAVDRAIAAALSLADGVGLVDSASYDLTTAGAGLGNVTLGTAPLGV